MVSAAPDGPLTGDGSYACMRCMAPVVTYRHVLLGAAVTAIAAAVLELVGASALLMTALTAYCGDSTPQAECDARHHTAAIAMPIATLVVIVVVAVPTWLLVRWALRRCSVAPTRTQVTGLALVMVGVPFLGLAMGIRQGEWAAGLLTFVVVVAAGALAWAAIARASMVAGMP